MGGYVQAMVSAALFGMIATITWVLYDAGASGFEIVFWRMSVAALAVAAVCCVRKMSLRVGRAKLGWVLLASMLYAFGILFLCLSYGTESSSGLMTTIYHTYPLIVMLSAAVLFRRRPGAFKLVAAACALAGAALALLSGEHWGFTPAGVALALASAVSYALYSVVLERPELQGIPVAGAVFVRLYGGGLVLSCADGLGAFAPGTEPCGRRRIGASGFGLYRRALPALHIRRSRGGQHPCCLALVP